MNQQANILVIMSDQHSPFLLGCAGNPMVRTPCLDRLAGEGVRFRNAYCPSPLCVPSRMSFMTGRTPSNNRVWNNRHTLSSGIPTWAHHLGAAGYETALIGRMHFIGPDQHHGFEHRLVGDVSSPIPGFPVFPENVWTRIPKETCGQDRQAIENAGRGSTIYQWYDQQVSEATCDYLRRRDDSAGRPFAAVAGFVLPHCPYVAPKALFDYYYDRVDIPAVEESQPVTVRRLREDRNVFEPPLSEHQVRVARAAYFALCEYFDMFVGRLLDCLDETGLAEDTLVVYASDHGESAGEHGCWAKMNYYESSVRVPLIARLPGVIEPQSTNSAICNLLDLAPTFAEVGGAEPMNQADGRSLWPLMQGERGPDEFDETTSEVFDANYSDPPVATRMIRSGQWKLWVAGYPELSPPALFNLEEDPDELNDRADDPQCESIKNELLEKVCRDWYPAGVIKQSRAANGDHDQLVRWGRAVRPSHPNFIQMPDDDIEADVELL